METINDMLIREFVCSKVVVDLNKRTLGQCKTLSFPKNDKLKEWQLHYHPAKDANIIDPQKNKNSVRMSIEFNQTVNGRVIVEANGLLREEYYISWSTHFDWDYLPHKDVHAAADHFANWKISVTVEVDVMTEYIPEIPSDYLNYNNILSDFEIHCKNMQYNEHIEVKTALDFFRSVPYAWHHNEENLKLKCANFWRENKDFLENSAEFKLYPHDFKISLNILGLGNDKLISDDMDYCAVIHDSDDIDDGNDINYVYGIADSDDDDEL